MSQNTFAPYDLLDDLYTTYGMLVDNDRNIP